jgi:cyanate permease
MSTTDQLTEDESRSPYRWVVLGGVWLIYFAFGLTIASMAPLIAPITRDLGISHSAMGAVLGAWPLVYIASAIPSGQLLDRAGARLSLFIAALILALSCILRGVADDFFTLFLAVGLFGIGGPLISIGAPKLISANFQGSERGLAMGIYITGPALGGVIALSLTNSVLMPLFENDWRSVLFTYAAVVILIGAVWGVLSQTPAFADRDTADHTEAQKPGWQVFLDLGRVREIQILLLMSIGIFFYNHGLNNWLPEILRSHGLSAADAGYWAAIPTATGVIASLAIPRFAIPENRIKILFALICAALIGVLMLRSSFSPFLLSGLILQGFARGTMLTVAMLILMDSDAVGNKNAGSAGGLFFSAAEIGGVLGPLSIGVIHDATGGFSTALTVLTGVAIMLILLLDRLRLALDKPKAQ